MFKFIKEKDPKNQFSINRVEMSCSGESLPEILESFEDFLRGCGFIFDGNLYIVSDEEEE
jgi:hypothetical protein